MKTILAATATVLGGIVLALFTALGVYAVTVVWLHAPVWVAIGVGIILLAGVFMINE